MTKPEQINLFDGQQWRAMSAPGVYRTGLPPLDWSLEQLQDWKQAVIRYQQNQTVFIQGDFWTQHTSATLPLIDPFTLGSESDRFFRFPSRFHQGDPCIYFVLDRAAPLILYIGETVNSRQRWQGHHDCKTYLRHYLNAHRRYGLTTQICWTFYWEVPWQTRPRKQLEQALIQQWLPPFNQESWSRWGAPWRIHYQATRD
ncbi:MAG: GIY-YIG nuclease family protein [Gloeomargarita sp. SKYG116]|nr:GIY-YIG nuclease family protein [Gloeomargarita sp. SKYG116]MDW8401458.1 GIY-YIG nuclease family protein [Gloeomargarita sp. SKYGB_i_bin116]